MRITRALSGVAAVAALASCAGSAGRSATPVRSPTTAPAASDLLVATATQTRPQIAVGGLFQVTVKSTSEAPFSVRSVALVSSGFAQLPPTPSDVRFDTGNVIALDLPYGDAVCDSGVDPLAARLEITAADGPKTVTVPLVSPYDLMKRIHDQQCQLRALARQVVLTLDLSPDGTGSLLVKRLDTTDPVRVGGIAGTVLYDVTASPVTVAPGQDEVREPVTFTSRTCLAHDVAEAKQPYRFLAYVAVGQAVEIGAPIPITEAQTVVLQGVLEKACPVLTAS